MHTLVQRIPRIQPLLSGCLEWIRHGIELRRILLAKLRSHPTIQSQKPTRRPWFDHMGFLQEKSILPHLPLIPRDSLSIRALNTAPEYHSTWLQRPPCKSSPTRKEPAGFVSWHTQDGRRGQNSPTQCWEELRESHFLHDGTTSEPPKTSCVASAWQFPKTGEVPCSSWH